MQPASPRMSTTPASRHRFHLLDAMRGLAALLIVPRHVDPSLTQLIPFRNSFLAVDFFFCLSGFVIAFSYDTRLQSTLTVRDFFAARVIRLYPLAIMGTALALTYHLFGGRLWATIPHSQLLFVSALSLALVPNFFVPIMQCALYPFNNPVWSLLYEMVANVSYAAMVRRRLAGVRTIAVVVVVALASLVLVVWKTASIDQGAVTSGVLVAFGRVAFSFFAGVLLLRLHQRQQVKFLTKGTGSVVAFFLIASLLAVLMIRGALMNTASFQLFAVIVLFPVIIYLGSLIRMGSRWNPLCSFLGEMSYPLYVLHVALLSLPAHLFLKTAITREFGIPLFVPCAACIAWLANHYFDVPVRRLLTEKYKSYRVARQVIQLHSERLHD